MPSEGREDDSDEDRAVRHWWWNWFLLDGQRLHVTVVTVTAIFVGVTAVTVSGLVPFDSVQPLFYVFGGMISGNLTVITVVVAINQLLLSRELYTPDEMETRIGGAIDYRDDIRDTVGQVPPVEPLGFLRLLVETSREGARTLGALTADETGADLRDTVDSLVADLVENADQIEAFLQESDPSTFRVLSATLTTNYSPQVRELRRIDWEHGDRLPEDVQASIELLVRHLKNIDVARQYFKAIYIQEELAAMSRQLFYVGLAALVVVTSGLLILTESSGASVPRPYFPVVVAAVITTGLAPISLLFAYIVRVATVAERTVAILPFTTAKQEH